MLTLPLPDRVADVAGRVMLSSNSVALAGALGEIPDGVGMGMANTPSAGHAVIVLALYTVAFAAMAMWLLRRRAIS